MASSERDSGGLPLAPPFPVLEARDVDNIPIGPEWQYEPKWDGFRCLAFRNRDDVFLQSKSGQPLARYFPELVEELMNLEAQQFVLDGEIMISLDGKLDFDALLERIHPAASRVKKLAHEMPASFVVFDILCDEHGHSFIAMPLRDRRKHLERFAASNIPAKRSKSEMRLPPISLSPATADLETVQNWFKHVGNALDGVIAKRLDARYDSTKRGAVEKIKNYRSADCVIGGYRLNKMKDGIGSLLLGLYDDEGLLNHVGFTSGFSKDERRSLLKKVKKLEKSPGFTGAAPGGPSRWSPHQEPWFPLEPVLVAEVSYDHVSGDRFRHGTKILRWRPDKAPEQCTTEQMRFAESIAPLFLLGKRN